MVVNRNSCHTLDDLTPKRLGVDGRGRGRSHAIAAFGHSDLQPRHGGGGAAGKSATYQGVYRFWWDCKGCALPAELSARGLILVDLPGAVNGETSATRAETATPTRPASRLLWALACP